MTRKLSLLVATCFFLCRAQGNAQGTTGSIWGTVRDQQGAGDAHPVDSTNATEGSLLDRRSIGDLPRGSGNYSGLVLLQPGVTSYAPAAGFSFEFSAGQRFSAAGGRGYTNSFLLDGTDI